MQARGDYWRSLAFPGPLSGGKLLHYAWVHACNKRVNSAILKHERTKHHSDLASALYLCRRANYVQSTIQTILTHTICAWLLFSSLAYRDSFDRFHQLNYRDSSYPCRFPYPSSVVQGCYIPSNHCFIEWETELVQTARAAFRIASPSAGSQTQHLSLGGSNRNQIAHKAPS
jgi:hypothetical protein